MHPMNKILLLGILSLACVLTAYLRVGIYNPKESREVSKKIWEKNAIILPKNRTNPTWPVSTTVPTRKMKATKTVTGIATTKAVHKKHPIRIILAGIAKNIRESHIRCHVPKLIRLGESFDSYHVIVYMNNSPENQKKAYEEELAKTKHSTFVYEDKSISGHHRTDKISKARNILLDIILNYKDSFDYVLMTDMDGVCGSCNMTRSYDPAVFHRMFRRSDEWDVLTFRFVPYWDLWAFRDETHMPYNKFGKLSRKNKFGSYEDFDKWLSSIPRTELIEVQSAYMMTAIYKMELLNGPRYSGEGEQGEMDCEHVAFHKQIREQKAGRIRLSPEVYCFESKGHVKL
eukprot:m.343573 g.343573  ORF g.343573 m.343573 type:complete len:344 (-) comp23035_c0_seq1:37-1068(-)